MINKKTRTFGYVCAVGSALCLVNTTLAQDDHWNGTITNTLWSVPGNWSLGVTRDCVFHRCNC